MYEPAAPVEHLELPDGSVIRELTSPAELHQAIDLYRTVFGYSLDDGGLNPRMLQGLRRNSGSVLGAVDPQGAVRAFAYGWTAVETDPADRHLYHYSQAAVVDTALQGRGVGRHLKRVQSAVAARAGVHRMRWTFDPLLTRNAHFNFDVLGARGRWYVPDLFGPGTDSDRITVEWRFSEVIDHHHASPPRATTSTAAPSAAETTDIDLHVGQIRRTDEGVEFVVPVAKPADKDDAASLRRAMADLFAEGLIAVSCRRLSPEIALYRFVKDIPTCA